VRELLSNQGDSLQALLHSAQRCRLNDPVRALSPVTSTDGEAKDKEEEEEEEKETKNTHYMYVGDSSHKKGRTTDPAHTPGAAAEVEEVCESEGETECERLRERTCVSVKESEVEEG